MSFDMHVAVHAQDWPTARAVQQCLNHQSFPVKLMGIGEDSWEKPFGPVLGSGLPISLHGKQLRMEVDVVTLSPTRSYGYGLFDSKPADINSDFLAMGISDVHFGYGDLVFTYSVIRTDGEYRAGFYIMAALIRCFHGYGFETQGMTHGGDNFAADLIRDAQAPSGEDDQ